jgi:hypothetical protein
MARTVSLPVAIAVRLVLEVHIKQTSFFMSELEFDTVLK